MAEDSGRITVSRDALRAELAKLELRLVEKLVTKTEHDGLAERVVRIEETIARYKGALALISIIVVGLISYLATHTHP